MTESLQMEEPTLAAISQLADSDPNLTELDLHKSGIDDPAARAIAAALMSANDSRLTVLDLSHNTIGDPGSCEISAALKLNRTLTTLNLSNNYIGQTGGAAIGTALQQNMRLTELDLGYNYVAQAVCDISASLAQNCALRELNLWRNSIENSGIRAICAALQTNTRLQSLNLGHNNLGDEGAIALSDALGHNRSLRTIDLRINGIGDVGAAALLEAVGLHDARVGRVALAHNPIDSILLQKILLICSGRPDPDRVRKWDRATTAASPVTTAAVQLATHVLQQSVQHRIPSTPIAAMASQQDHAPTDSHRRTCEPMPSSGSEGTRQLLLSWLGNSPKIDQYVHALAKHGYDTPEMLQEAYDDELSELQLQLMGMCRPHARRVMMHVRLDGTGDGHPDRHHPPQRDNRHVLPSSGRLPNATAELDQHCSLDSNRKALDAASVNLAGEAPLGASPIKMDVQRMSAGLGKWTGEYWKTSTGGLSNVSERDTSRDAGHAIGGSSRDAGHAIGGSSRDAGHAIGGSIRDADHADRGSSREADHADRGSSCLAASIEFIADRCLLGVRKPGEPPMVLADIAAYDPNHTPAAGGEWWSALQVAKAKRLLTQPLSYDSRQQLSHAQS
jgi:hypothetical protein